MFLNMWACHQQRLLVVWGRGRSAWGSGGGVASGSASHHISAPLLQAEDEQRRPRRLKAERERTAQTGPRPRRSETEGPGAGLGAGPGAGPRKSPAPHRVSSELQKLSLEDSGPNERERPPTPRPTPRPAPAPEEVEVVFGVAPCLLALTRGRRTLRRLFVKDGGVADRPSVVRLCEEACRQGVQVQRVSKRELDRLSSGNVHQGACLQAGPLGFVSQRPDAAVAPRGPGVPLWLVLERIQDPMNLGAILRSAYFLGVDRVASSVRSSCPLSPVVSKASSGAMEALEVYGYEDLAQMVRAKVARGWQAVGTVAAGTDAGPVPVAACWDFEMRRPTLLLIGGEGTGLSQELRALCGALLTIPPGRDLFPGIESLNVSVATGILLHRLLASRSSSRPSAGTD